MDIPTKALHNKAEFSDCMDYRFTLRRDFGLGEGIINFIMLNPSTANEEFNDPTVARCENRALAGGFQEMIVTNIFAYRATDPKNMKQVVSDKHIGPIGDKNDQAIIHSADIADMIICAWGNHGLFMERGMNVKKILQPFAYKLHYLKLNGNGEPAHPLYLPKDLVPSKWI